MECKTTHSPVCHCSGCLALAWGKWLDELGRETALGAWTWFLTLSFRTPTYPWARGFPNSGSGRPNPEFAHASFQFLVSRLESDLGTQVDYAVTDELGSVNGRFHLHALLAAEGLEPCDRKCVEGWAMTRIGFSRVLPFEEGAAYYVGKYIGRGVRDVCWDIRVGKQKMMKVRKPAIWGNVVVASANMPRSLFHQNFLKRHR